MRGLLIDVAAAVPAPVDLDGSFRLNPRVSLRPEPFGALAYHFGNRRLSFLRSPDMVRLVAALEHHPTLRATLEALDIAPARWTSFCSALATLMASDMVEARHDG